MIIRTLALALSLIVTLHGQELAPELAPLAAKYSADSEGITAKQAAAIDKAAHTYGMALDTAERSATAAGDVKAVSG